MNVYDFLKTINVEDVAKCYVERRDYDEEPELPSEDEMIKILGRFVESLLRKIPASKSEYIIVPVKYKEYGKEGVYAISYKKDDIASFKPALTMGEMEDNAVKAQTCDITELPYLIDTSLPESYSYSFTPWEETLAHEVFLPNDNPEYIAAFAEDLLWGMSFNGYTEESQDERRQELNEMIENSEKAVKEGRYRSSDEVFSELREKYGFEDLRTPEEKEADKRRIYMEIIEAQIAITCMLLLCQNSLRQAK